MKYNVKIITISNSIKEPFLYKFSKFLRVKIRFFVRWLSMNDFKTKYKQPYQ